MADRGGLRSAVLGQEVPAGGGGERGDGGWRARGGGRGEHRGGGQRPGRLVAGRLAEVMGCFAFRPGACLGFGQWMPKI